MFEHTRIRDEIQKEREAHRRDQKFINYLMVTLSVITLTGLLIFTWYTK